MTEHLPLHRPSRDHRRVSIVGDIYTVVLTGNETNGQLMMIDALIPPGGGPPPHVHTREDETFYILEGEMTFMRDESTITAGPGDMVHMPRGTKHAFRNNSDQQVRMLFSCTPSGLDAMFLEVGVPLQPGDPPAPVTDDAIATLLDACPRYGIAIAPPPA